MENGLMDFLRLAPPRKSTFFPDTVLWPQSVRETLQRKAADKPDWRLYDLSEDIGEKNDLADEHPEIVQKIFSLLKRDGLL